jgi:hypothetical protein
MQEYDVSLKTLLRNSAVYTIRELTGGAIVNWLDVEFPKVQNLRADMVGESTDGEIFHLELQSRNEPSMALRMLEYCTGIFRLRGSFPRQILLYVGEPALRMDAELHGPGLSFSFHAVDIRSLDGDRLIESPFVGDNVIAILARLRDAREAVRRIIRKIGDLPSAEQAAAIYQLLKFAGLRRLAAVVEEETHKMPIEIDILENEVLGREYKRGLAAGKELGLAAGEERGQRLGELHALRRLLEKRFGLLPVWAEEHLAARTQDELDDLLSRVLDATSLENLLK